MTLNFTDKVFTISGEGTPTIQFYKRGFNLTGGSTEPVWQDIILSGNTALTLAGAKANGLNYVKLFGATEQSNLPSGYTQLKYVQNTATTTKINTNVMPEVGDEIEIRFITPYTASTSNYLLQSRESNNAGIFGISGSQTGKTIILSWGSGNSVTSAITREYNHVYVIKASVIGTTLTLYVKDVTACTEDTVTGTITTPSDAVTPYYIWGNGNPDNPPPSGQYLQQVTPVYYARITNNGRTKLNYVAAKDSNNSASFYDLVNNTFITTFEGTITGSDDVAIPTPDTPMDIKSNNGVLKVSKNLFDMSKAVRGDIASADGSVSTSILYRIVSDYIPVQVGRSYVASGKICFEGNANEYNSRLITAFYDSNKVFIAGSRISRQNIFTFEIPDGTSFVRVEYWGDQAQGNTVDTGRSKLQFELGTTATDYMPYGQIYTDGTVETVTDSLNNTATAEMLLAIGNYKDTQEILTGEVSKNVGIKVLTGAETWTTVEQTGGRYRYKARLSDAVIGMDVLYSNNFLGGKTITEINADTTLTEACTLYQSSLFIYTQTFATATDLTTWLANQYANGTPVILIYPLATSTTETVTGQTLSTQAGTNTITATGYLDNLGLEVSYKGI